MIESFHLHKEDQGSVTTLGVANEKRVIELTFSKTAFSLAGIYTWGAFELVSFASSSEGELHGRKTITANERENKKINCHCTKQKLTLRWLSWQDRFEWKCELVR